MKISAYGWQRAEPKNRESTTHKDADASVAASKSTADASERVLRLPFARLPAELNECILGHADAQSFFALRRLNRWTHQYCGEMRAMRALVRNTAPPGATLGLASPADAGTPSPGTGALLRQLRGEATLAAAARQMPLQLVSLGPWSKPAAAALCWFSADALRIDFVRGKSYATLDVVAAAESAGKRRGAPLRKWSQKLLARLADAPPPPKLHWQHALFGLSVEQALGHNAVLVRGSDGQRHLGQLGWQGGTPTLPVSVPLPANFFPAADKGACIDREARLIVGFDPHQASRPVLFDLRKNASLAITLPASHGVFGRVSAQLSDNGRRLLCVQGQYGDAFLYRTRGGTPPHAQLLGRFSEVASAELSPNGRYVFVDSCGLNGVHRSIYASDPARHPPLLLPYIDGTLLAVRWGATSEALVAVTQDLQVLRLYVDVQARRLSISHHVRLGISAGFFHRLDLAPNGMRALIQTSGGANAAQALLVNFAASTPRVERVPPATLFWRN